MPRRSSRHSPASRHSSRRASSHRPWRSSRRLARGDRADASTASACRCRSASACAARRPRRATARRSAGCRASSRRSAAATPERPGERGRDARHDRPGTRGRGHGRPRPTSTKRRSGRRSRRSWIRSCRWSRSSTSGWSHASRSAPDAIDVEILPTFVGCPALDAHPRRGRRTSGRLRAPGPRRLDVRGAVDVGADHAGWVGRPSPRPGSRRRRASGDGPLSVLRLGAGRDGQRLRADPVPLALLLPGVPPAVRGLKPSDGGASRSASVGVVGAGTMGAGIAQLALEAGHEVVLYDVDPAASASRIMRIRDGLDRRAARLDLDADAIDDWVDGRLARLRVVAGLDDLAGQPEVVIEAALEDLRRSARSSRPSTRRAPTRDDPRDEHERAVRRGDRGRHAATRAGRWACTSSTRRRSCASSRSSARRPRRVHDRRAVESPMQRGAGPRSGRPTPRASSSTGSTGLHARGARRARGRRSVDRGDRPGDARRRLPDGTVRADGPHRHRREPGGQHRACTMRPSRPTIRSRIGSGRRRIQARLVAAGRLGRKTGRASTATMEGTHEARPTGDGRRRSAPRSSSGPRSSRRSTRRIAHSATASRRRRTSTSRCASERATRRVPSSERA